MWPVSAKYTMQLVKFTNKWKPGDACELVKQELQAKQVGGLCICLSNLCLCFLPIQLSSYYAPLL